MLKEINYIVNKWNLLFFKIPIWNPSSSDLILKVNVTMETVQVQVLKDA